MINYTSIEEALKKEGYIITSFEGFSMYPTFLKNDLLVIIPSYTYNLYDVVLYKKDNRYVAHRIIDVKDDFYIIRGDNTITDEVVPKECVLARIDSLIRNKEEIKLESHKNAKDFNKSIESLRFRKLKNRIKKLIKHE